MRSPDHKTKQYTLVLFKTGLLIAAAWMIYDRLDLSGNSTLDQSLPEQMVKDLMNPVVICCLLGFTAANWFFEILKWQALLTGKFSVSLKTAARQVLASHTAAILTPARAGEYVAKALFFNRSHCKTILKRNVLGNSYQLAATVIFGCVGMVIILTQYFPEYLVLYGLIMTGILIGMLFLKSNPAFFGQKSSRLLAAVVLPANLKTAGLYSLLRYIIFSHQFYLLLWLLGVEASYFILMALISLMYLISSLLPVLQLFDGVIKGSVALFLFGLIGAEDTVILVITMLMWLLNFGIPALTGGILLLIPGAKSTGRKLATV